MACHYLVWVIVVRSEISLFCDKTFKVRTKKHLQCDHTVMVGGQESMVRAHSLFRQTYMANNYAQTPYGHILRTALTAVLKLFYKMFELMSQLILFTFSLL